MIVDLAMPTQPIARAIAQVAFRGMLEHELQANTLAAVPFSPQKFLRPMGIVYRQGRRLYPNTEEFIKLLRTGGNGPAKDKTKPSTQQQQRPR